MALLLVHGGFPPDLQADVRVSLSVLDGVDGCADVADVLEQARQRVVADYLDLCRRLAAEPGAQLSHTPSAATNASDLLTMMAWTDLARNWAAGADRVALSCDDPWLYRHLMALPGVSAQAPPPLPRLRLVLRGWAARVRYAVKALAAWITAKPYAGAGGGAWLLSYPHPAHGDAIDAYFGDLPTHLPCRRVLHVDGAAAAGLPSLNAWGRPWWIVRLPFARWRPSVVWRGDWLVRRAAALEAATAQAASIRWQILCQGRWMNQVRPQAVAWPWENHGWERALAAQARAVGCRTIGYQHTVIGRTEFNHHAAIDRAALPDRILCAGAISRDHLIAWGHAPERLEIGGALRHQEAAVPGFDPEGPVFFALPSDLRVARQMVKAAVELGRPVLVRPHPAYDVMVPVSDLVRRADRPFSQQQGLAAVVYAATTVGLEAIVAGLPTIRFRPAGCIALDILPNNISLPVAGAEDLAQALAWACPPPMLTRDQLFAPVDHACWRTALLDTAAS